MREQGRKPRRDADAEPSLGDSALPSIPPTELARRLDAVVAEGEPSPEEHRERVEHRFDEIGIAAPALSPAPPVQRRPAKIPIQRDGPLTLQTPSLLQPADPAARYHLGGDQHLHLDPAIEQMARQIVLQQLNPAALRPALSQVRLGGPRVPTAAGGGPGLPPIGGSGGGTTGTAAAALSGPPIPQAAPLVPAGAGPDSPRPADVSDVLGAIMAIPAIDQGITGLQTQATDLVTRDWRKLATGEKIGVVSTIAVIGLGTLGGVASDPKARQFALSQLNGRVLPVPGVDWLHLEVNTGGDSLMVGMHVDMGQLLPKSWGFGAGSPSAIGGPPQPEPFVPGQRQHDPTQSDHDDKGRSGLSIGQQIVAAEGSGAPLDDLVRPRLESGLGAHLADVRVHTGSRADSLARSVDAVAFTSGRSIFFQSGAYAPSSSDGYRLLAHEATHTLQQAAGPVSGTPARGGVSLSDPSDPFERAADRAADIAARSDAEPRGAAPSGAGHSSIGLPAYPRAVAVQRRPGGTEPGAGGNEVPPAAADTNTLTPSDGIHSNVPKVQARPKRTDEGMAGLAPVTRTEVDDRRLSSAPSTPHGHHFGAVSVVAAAPPLQRLASPTPGVSQEANQAPGDAAQDLSDGEHAGVSSDVAAATQGGGQSLDSSTRGFMEPRLGFDFGQVRIHSGSAPADAARSVDARAYTLGNDIVFGAGQYAPGTAEGRRLLAHELTHVVQQSKGPVSGVPLQDGLQVSVPSDSFEEAARETADRVSAGGLASPSLAVAPLPAPVRRKATGEGQVLQRDTPTSTPAAPSPPPATAATTPAATPAVPSADEVKEQEQKAFDTLKGRAGRPAATVWFSSPLKPKEDWVTEVFTIGEVLDRSGGSGRKGFDTQAPAVAYAAVAGGDVGAVAIREDKFFFAARLNPGKHKLTVVDETRGWELWKGEYWSRDYVYRVSEQPGANVVAVTGRSQFVFPLGKDLMVDPGKAKAQSDPQVANAADAEGMRAVAGVVPEGARGPAGAPPAGSAPAGKADQVAIESGQEEKFILAYFRSRGTEALQQNEAQVDRLAQQFKPTTAGTPQAPGHGVSPAAKAMIDSGRENGEKFRGLLDQETRLEAQLAFMNAKKEYGLRDKDNLENTVHDWSIETKKGAKLLSACIAEETEALQKIRGDKNLLMALSPLLAQLVGPNTDRHVAPRYRNEGLEGPISREPESPGEFDAESNPYNKSLLNKPKSPESDEAIRADFEAKLDGVRKAIRTARAEMIGGDTSFLLGLEGLQTRVKADLASVTGPNAGLKDRLAKMLEGKAIVDTVVKVAGMTIQIGLMFVPGGQFLSAAMGFALAAKEMSEHAREWDVSKAAVDPAAALADQQKAVEKLADDAVNVAISAVDVGTSFVQGLSALEAGRIPKDMKPVKVDEATEGAKKLAGDLPVNKAAVPPKLNPWKAEELSAEFTSQLEKLGISASARTIAPETVLKNCNNDWNAVKKALLEASGTPAEKAAGAFFMEKMTAFRRTTNDVLLKESFVAVEAKHGIQGQHSSEAVGRTTLTSDLDYSIKGPHAEEVVQEFNQRYRARFQAESGVVFDTNAYTSPSFLEYPIHPDPTKPAKTIDVVPLNAAAKDSTGGLEAWKKFEGNTLGAARSVEERARLNTLMREAEKLYPHDLGARLRHVGNFQQDVASHITACENFMSHGADGPQQWAKYQEDLLAKTPADKKEAMQRVFKEAEAKAKGYQNDVRQKLKQLYPEKTFTEAEIAEMAHSKEPAKMDMYLAARNRLYEDKLKGVSELKALYAKATTEADRMAIAAQINAKQSEALYFASESFQTSGSILSVVQNAQKAGQKVLDPAFGSLVGSQARAAFFEQYGKAMSYGTDLSGVLKASKVTERSAYAVMAHPLAAGQGMPKAIDTAKSLNALKEPTEQAVFEVLKKSYPEAKDVAEALKMHHGAMASARKELAGRMMEMSGRPLPDIQLAWEKLGEGGNTVSIARLLSLLSQAAAADD